MKWRSSIKILCTLVCVLHSSIRTNAIGKRSGRNTARNNSSLRTRLREESSWHHLSELIISLHGLRGLEREGCGLRIVIYFLILSVFIINDPADDFFAISIKKIVFLKRKRNQYQEILLIFILLLLLQSSFTNTQILFLLNLLLWDTYFPTIWLGLFFLFWLGSRWILWEDLEDLANT